jgi:predicted nucleotidyltransferase
MFKDLIKKIAAELARRRIPYMIIGGQAVLLYGEPRLTKDIDVTLGLGVDELPKIKLAVKAIGLSVEAEDADSFVKETMVLPTSEKTSGIRVDFIFSFSPFERQAVARAKVVTFDQTPVRFASLEDLVIHKLVAGRPRDIEDVKAVLLKNPGYDRDYIKRWLADFDATIDSKCLHVFDDIVREIAQKAAKKPPELGGTAKSLRPIPRRRAPRG